MFITQRLRYRWFLHGTDVRLRSRPSRRRTGREWAVESLEGRPLLSTYVVVSANDSATGTLRWAIDQANQDHTDDTIRISPTLAGQTITLTSGPLDIRKPSGTLRILGPFIGRVTISGDGGSQVFSLEPRATVTIGGLTITDGVSPVGGGISNNGNLTLIDDTINGNTAQGGGGGGIDNEQFGTLTIAYSTISDNLGRLAVGGITNAGTMTIVNSTINGNVTLASTSSGGISNSGTLTIVNSTISGNTTNVGTGGGIQNSSVLTMYDDTVASNTAEGSGGGIANDAFSGASLTLSNTIVADNLSMQDPRTDDMFDDGDVGNTQLVGGYDLIGSGDLGALQNTLTGVNPELGPLQDNGGPTQTMALLPNSPAIRAGDAALVPKGLWTDQRGPGHPRFHDGFVDIGAFEFQGDDRGLSHELMLGQPARPDVVGSDIGLTIIVGNSSAKTSGAD